MNTELTMSIEGITIPDETTQEQWPAIHRKILIANKASSKWVRQSRAWAAARWGIDFVAETEVQLELSLGIESKDKPATLNPGDKSKAIVTIEGISQSFQMWQRKMSGDIEQWDRDKCEKALSLIEPIARLASELRSKLGQG